MEVGEFAEASADYCNRYFSAVEIASATGQLTTPDRQRVRPLYPSLLVLYDTPTHFVAELVGVSDSFGGVIPSVIRTVPSLGSVLGNFDVAVADGHGLMHGGDRHYRHLSFTHVRDAALIASRFPELDSLQESKILIASPLTNEDVFNPLVVGPAFEDVWLDDVLTVSSYLGQIRARYYQNAWIIEHSATKPQLWRRLRSKHPMLTSTYLLPGKVGDEDRSRLVGAAGLATLSSIDHVGETTITKFLELNEGILLKALGGVELIPQPSLRWIEGNPDPDEVAIQPDFILVDASGAGHLCEMKLPLLGKTTMTTGGHRRRRFVVPVSDGYAQLANYQEYFTFDANRALASEQLGIRFDQPRSILIVGSGENFDEAEVREAQRMLKPIELIDYDSLRAMYLLAAGYMPG